MTVTKLCSCKCIACLFTLPTAYSCLHTIQKSVPKHHYSVFTIYYTDSTATITNLKNQIQFFKSELPPVLLQRPLDITA